MSKGFIKIDRSFFEGDDWRQQRAFSRAEAWIDLFQCARFEDGSVTKRLVSGRVVNIKQGEIHASLRYLARRWGWGVEKTKRFIDSAKKKQQIEHRTEQGESIISIVNYDYYTSLEGNEIREKMLKEKIIRRLKQN